MKPLRISAEDASSAVDYAKEDLASAVAARRAREESINDARVLLQYAKDSLASARRVQAAAVKRLDRALRRRKAAL